MTTLLRNPRITPHIRWMIRRDMQDVLAIENDAFQYPWNEDDFIRSLRQRTVIGMVAEYAERIYGYMLYELHHSRLHVLNFAVHPDRRRVGVGSAMVNKLKSKLSPGRRTRLLLEVRETNLDAQLFFASQGFRAVEVLRGFCQETDEDAYLFRERMNFSERLEANVNRPSVRRLPATDKVHQVATARIPEDLYERMRRAAMASRVSLNAFMVTAIEIAVSEVERNERREP